jgi:hypothetical protein
VDSILSAEEIGLLKELKGAGERDRILPQAQSALARLLRVGMSSGVRTKQARTDM